MRPALLGALLLTACTGSVDRKPAETAVPDIGSTTFSPSLGIELSAMTRTPRGVYLRELSPGTGAPAGPGQQVAIHYQGSLANGQPFDANGPMDPPFVFRLGAGEVVPGFDEGVTGMRAGGRRQLIIPPALGYGAQPNGPIPPNSILVFTIELVRVQ
ncbi:MAG TPA: FKBP-type peptidyl-prolyl cis-trans isomerase [Gemmatimonadales bacterium]|jgi:peptidylprolyl isomerase|nr:FKBP-type peptidyl-prolyl cis-trans isomerase [Gemmatimonadales bacterium]